MIGAFVGALVLGPHALAADGTSGMCDYAGIDCETGQVFDSQDPPHVICINGVCQTATGHGTATYTVTSESVSTNTLYCAGGLICAASVPDTATGTGTGSTTATRTVTDNNRIMSPVAYTWEGTSTRTGTYCFTSTGTTTATLTVTGLTGDSLTRTGTGTASGSGTVTATITGTATATGTNTGTGTITGVGTATATASGTFAASSTNDAQSVFVAVGTVADTATHAATGVQTVTVTLATSGIGTTTSTSPPVSTVVTLTATSTVTGTASGTWTNTTTHTVTGTSARISDNPTVSDTKTNTHVLGVPRGANKTLNATGTTVLASTDFATSSPMPSAIPLAGTDSRLDIGWLPTGTATDSVVTGADPRLTDARASTNTLYQGTTNVSFSTGTSTTTATSAAVADNPKIHVAMSTGNLVGTLTDNYVPKATGTSTLANSRIYDNGTYAGVGMGTSVAAAWHVNGKAKSTYLDPGYVTTDLLPDGTGKNVGSATYPWQDGHFSGNVYSANNNFFTSYTNSASSDLSVSTAGACQVVATVNVSVTATAASALVFGAISFGTTDPSMGCAMLISDETAATVMDWSRTMGIAYGLVSGGSMATSGNWSFTGTGTHTVTLQICNHQAVSHNCTVNASSNDWHNATLTVQMYGH